MRVPAQDRPRSSVTRSVVKSYPAPVGGWNARDALADMGLTDAIVLDNWMPKTNYVEIRGGWATSATGTTGNVKTLAPYNALNGTNKLFAYTASGIYDVSSSGAVGASKLSRTNGKHQYTMFGDGTSNWLIACNGVDKPAYFDGTTWTAVDGASTPALTGVTTTTLVQPVVFKGRMFFVQDATLSVWYLAAGAAGGALTEIDLSAEFKRGGYLMQMAVWTRDAGDGQDDVACFISSEGEVAVYQGNNPAVAANWVKIGVYTIGRPIGRRCTTQFGGDLIILTQNGAFPLSQALQSSTIDYKLALSFKIESAFTAATNSYSSIFGWEPILYPAQSALIVNVPIAEDGTHYQYVMNTITKAWCRFKAWDIETMAVFNGELYGAAGTGTRKLWTGTIDGTNNIEAYGKTAFSYFGTRGALKQFKLYRPVLATNGDVAFLTDIDVDFGDDEISGTTTYSTGSGAVWDVATWDNAFWQSGTTVVKQWTSPNEWQGYCASAKIKIATNSLMIQWMSNDMIFETGQIF